MNESSKKPENFKSYLARYFLRISKKTNRVALSILKSITLPKSFLKRFARVVFIERSF